MSAVLSADASKICRICPVFSESCQQFCQQKFPQFFLNRCCWKAPRSTDENRPAHPSPPIFVISLKGNQDRRAVDGSGGIEADRDEPRVTHAASGGSKPASRRSFTTARRWHAVPFQAHHDLAGFDRASLVGWSASPVGHWRRHGERPSTNHDDPEPSGRRRGKAGGGARLARGTGVQQKRQARCVARDDEWVLNANRIRMRNETGGHVRERPTREPMRAGRYSGIPSSRGRKQDRGRPLRRAARRPDPHECREWIGERFWSAPFRIWSDA